MTTAAPFYLYQFGTTTIPGSQGAFAFPTESENTLTRTVGGVFRAAGSGKARRKYPYQVSYTGLSVHATDTSQIRVELDTLKARSGDVDRLWLHTADGFDRWCWAELTAVSPAIKATDRATVQFALAFQVIGQWHGQPHSGSWNLDAGYYFDNGLYFDQGLETFTLLASPQTCVVPNGGNATVTDAGITVTAGTDPITAFKLSISDVCEWTFDQTIAAGKSLVVDCGSCTVRNDGVDAFNYLNTTAGHHAQSWLELASGSNNVTLTLTGIGSTEPAITFTYSDGWA